MPPRIGTCRRIAAAIIALAATPVAAIQAQQPPASTRCHAAMRALGGQPDEGEEGCQQLAAFLVDALTAKASRTASRQADTALQLAPRKLQSVRAGGTGASGVPGQSEAVPTAQPTGLASASIAAAGTDRGAKALAAISLNPITLFGGTAEDAARWSRVGDLTLLIPLQSDSTAGAAGRFSYFGIRGRINMTGLSAGDRLLEDFNRAFETALKAQVDLMAGITAAFEALSSGEAVEACARAIRSAAWGDAPAACDGRVTIGLKEADYRRLRETLVRAREEADSKYFGLDLRFDAGDPTLAGDPEKEVVALQAGLAFGRRFLEASTTATTLAMSGRLGVRYSELRANHDNVTWSLDGALGFEASRLVSPDVAVRFGAGLELRYANQSDQVAALHQTDYLAVRGGLTVPMSMGTAITVAFAAPLVGDLTPSLSVNFNWAMLFPGLAPPPR